MSRSALECVMCDGKPARGLGGAGHDPTISEKDPSKVSPGLPQCSALRCRAPVLDIIVDLHYILKQSAAQDYATEHCEQRERGKQKAVPRSHAPVINSGSGTEFLHPSSDVAVPNYRSCCRRLDTKASLPTVHYCEVLYKIHLALYNIHAWTLSASVGRSELNKALRARKQKTTWMISRIRAMIWTIIAGQMRMLMKPARKDVAMKFSSIGPLPTSLTADMKVM
mmetsp:Transcript_4499/g.12628  ORF Transcript_4499/g.12628 Transcript_4499/m.12628 type:complete len:224 (-) Transcript_4499:332-1003(-)